MSLIVLLPHLTPFLAVPLKPLKSASFPQEVKDFQAVHLPYQAVYSALFWWFHTG